MPSNHSNAASVCSLRRGVLVLASLLSILNAAAMLEVSIACCSNQVNETSKHWLLPFRLAIEIVGLSLRCVTMTTEVFLDCKIVLALSSLPENRPSCHSTCTFQWYSFAFRTILLTTVLLDVPKNVDFFFVVVVYVLPVSISTFSSFKNSDDCLLWNRNVVAVLDLLPLSAAAIKISLVKPNSCRMLTAAMMLVLVSCSDMSNLFS
mmetsp:Transcript_12322/g.35734  ORF Transcript_12322/g.35734 Transcript_12322/m.35734 type:complete len:206 (-) Transcript_12322:211-828(-)